ncbi:MAG: sigma-70 family RNA polymerase sigma factor [Firmicutes bacterium]|nr:sigma-70 family RNA polymerase sigma factor [Bacillota bacterium]MCM1400695.1 sigma-70 family RNA polymerase sigma factor [Bacteroides sp.]MCM1476389.1 sigma-70 family RNA polymerase sigma factor [Bacteroides sp.]
MHQSPKESSTGLGALFERLRPRLIAAGRRLLGSESDASDAMQDTFVKLWSTESRPSEAVVVTAMRNTCIDALRRRHPADDLTDDVAADESSTEESDLFHQVNRVIESVLSERDRSILLMRDRDGYEIDAIAARTDLTEANVRIILSRARKAVRLAYRQRFANSQK